MSDSTDVHGLPAKWRAEAEDCDAKAREREAESPRNGQWFRGCANGHRLAADELEDALRQSGEAGDRVADAAELSRLANLHGTRSYAMDGRTGCTHQGWSFRPEQLANFAAALRYSDDAVAQINDALGEAFKDDPVGAMKAHAAVMQIITRLAAPPATSGLVEALREARTSLQTIADLAGGIEYLRSVGDIRSFASNRAFVATAALAAHDASKQP